MEKGIIGGIGQIVWFIAALFLFGFLFAFTKVLKRKLSNWIVSFVIALAFMLVVNLIFLAIIP